MCQLIGLCGYIGNGKDTLANLMIEHYQFRKLAFASPIKDIVSSVFGWSRDKLEGASPEDRAWREQKDEWWSNALSTEIIPRKMLQLVGTDMFRDQISPRIWTAVIEKCIQDIWSCDPSTRLVISDCRFPEEMEMIRRLGGIIVFIHRHKPAWYDRLMKYREVLRAENYELAEQYKVYVHASELLMVDIVPDVQIYNDQTIDHLKHQLDVLMEFNSLNLEN